MEILIKPVPEWALETHGATAIELGLWVEPAPEPLGSAPEPETPPSAPEPAALSPWAME